MPPKKRGRNGSPVRLMVAFYYSVASECARGGSSGLSLRSVAPSPPRPQATANAAIFVASVVAVSRMTLVRHAGLARIAGCHSWRFVMTLSISIRLAGGARARSISSEVEDGAAASVCLEVACEPASPARKRAGAKRLPPNHALGDRTPTRPAPDPAVSDPQASTIHLSTRHCAPRETVRICASSWFHRPSRGEDRASFAPWFDRSVSPTVWLGQTLQYQKGLRAARDRDPPNALAPREWAGFGTSPGPRAWVTDRGPRAASRGHRPGQ